MPVWMDDAHVHETLIRQRLAACERDATMSHMAHVARWPRTRRAWWALIQSFVRSAAAARLRPVARGVGR